MSPLSSHFQTLLYDPSCAKSQGARSAVSDSTEGQDQHPNSRLLLLEADSGPPEDPGSSFVKPMPRVIRTGLGTADPGVWTWRMHEPRGAPRPPPSCGYSPHHGEEDGPTAQQVYQKQRILPQAILRRALLGGLYDDVGHVCQHLRTREVAEALRQGQASTTAAPRGVGTRAGGPPTTATAFPPGPHAFQNTPPSHPGAVSVPSS